MARVAALLTTLVAVLALGGTASAKTKWLCFPGAKHSPCEGSLTASKVDTDGNVTGTEKTAVPKKPKIDCFYVYPTVSGQKSTNANLHVDPEQTAIAEYQAQRFSQDCKVYAPMYRQLTLQGILDPSKITPKARAIAFKGVLDAWHEYLAKYNHGRGVVLIGHSQGSFVLRQLMTQEVDKKKAERKLLVSALLMGGNVLVKDGKDYGGDFQKIHACHTPSQAHCVVAYSTFNATPPSDALFGRTTVKGQHVLCTNPGNLGGGPARLSGYDFATPFPGTLGVAVNQFIGPLPSVSTPWIVVPGTYTAQCSSADGANVLLVKASNGARDFTPSPTAGWGWHLGDVNLALGNLTKLVKSQAAAWLKAG
jgi:hypothetical protein